MSWEIRSVSDKTVEIVKQKAKERGLTIGQFLDWHFCREVEVVGAKKPDRVKEYKLKLSEKSMESLKRKALENGFNISKYLEYLSQEGTNE